MSAGELPDADCYHCVCTGYAVLAEEERDVVQAGGIPQRLEILGREPELLAKLDGPAADAFGMAA